MQPFSSLSLLLFLFTQVCVCFPGANLTSNLDRIKIVFTPMMCRRMCSGGRCYNSCEKGDITTVYSETSQQQPPNNNQGYRLCECWHQALWLSLTLIFLMCLFLLLLVSSCLFSFLFYVLWVSILVSHCFYRVSLTKWVPSGMLSVLNTNLREEAEWWRLKLRATLKTLTVNEKER